jgi:hypothetical protein
MDCEPFLLSDTRLTIPSSTYMWPCAGARSCPAVTEDGLVWPVFSISWCTSAACEWNWSSNHPRSFLQPAQRSRQPDPKVAFQVFAYRYLRPFAVLFVSSVQHKIRDWAVEVDLSDRQGRHFAFPESCQHKRLVNECSFLASSL